MIRLRDVSKSYDGGEMFAVNRVSLEVAEGETLVLLGSSGCGKTTTLKMINRLIEPTEGLLEIEGRNVLDQDPIALRRKIGYAIQDIGLFPHMTVAENVGVVPRLLGWSTARIDDRVDELLEMVRLDPDAFRDRFPGQLSGGQKQRIGVARALGADPPVILMDEPFGALDPITREELQNEFLELESEIQKTVVFVTHDVFEAVRMGDRIALLKEGELQQVATPKDLVERPANEFVDEFLGRHRFQLALLIRKVGSIVPESREGPAPEERPVVYLSARAGLVEALDLYKTTGRESIPVYEGRKFRGHLTKKQLTDSIGEVLGETGGGQ